VPEFRRRFDVERGAAAADPASALRAILPLR